MCKINACLGGVSIMKPMKDSIYDVITWSNSHQDDLVVMYLSHFDGEDDCPSQVSRIL